MSKFEPDWDEYIDFVDKTNKPQKSHRVGDLVRLNRGSTPMIVLHIDPDNVIWAVYANRDGNWPITKDHYKDYKHFASYHRHISGFTAWDGEPINKKWNYIMPRRYRSIAHPNISGVYMNTATNGDMILELDDGKIQVFKPHHLEEDIPDTFRVKATGNNYSCHYQVPRGVTLQVGDILVSESASVYVVQEINTKNLNPKGVFKGRRLITEAL